jgi:hypothetical protein
MFEERGCRCSFYNNNVASNLSILYLFISLRHCYEIYTKLFFVLCSICCGLHCLAFINTTFFELKGANVFKSSTRCGPSKSCTTSTPYSVHNPQRPSSYFPNPSKSTESLQQRNSTDSGWEKHIPIARLTFRLRVPRVSETCIGLQPNYASCSRRRVDGACCKSIFPFDQLAGWPK